MSGSPIIFPLLDGSGADPDAASHRGQQDRESGSWTLDNGAVVTTAGLTCEMVSRSSEVAQQPKVDVDVDRRRDSQCVTLHPVMPRMSRRVATMVVVSKPHSFQGSVVRSNGRPPFMSGPGEGQLTCGTCHQVLVVGFAAIADTIFECSGCGAYNKPVIRQGRDSHSDPQ